MNEATVALALEVMIALLARAGEISVLIQKAQLDGRTTLLPEEWAAVTAANDAARARLANVIAAKGTAAPPA